MCPPRSLSLSFSLLCTFFFLTACPLIPPFFPLCPTHCCSLPQLLQLVPFSFLFSLSLLFLRPLFHVSLLLYHFCLCRASVFGGCRYRESWKLLQPFTQLQCVQHRPGHQRGYHHAAARRVLWAQEWRPAYPMSVGGHQLRSGPAHPNVHSHRPGGEDGGTCDHWPQR